MRCFGEFKGRGGALGDSATWIKENKEGTYLSFPAKLGKKDRNKFGHRLHYLPWEV